MGKRLRVIDNYSATAAGGVGGNDDFIDVDTDIGTLSGLGDVARDFAAVPITIEWDSGGGVMARLNTICTGWQASPPKLWINPMYNSGTSGAAASVFCAPNAPTLACTQLAQSLGGSLSGGQYDAEYGVTHYVNVTGAGTVNLAYAYQNYAEPFQNYSQVFNDGHVTRLILTDANTNQPALTWQTTYGNLIWENGAPQFTAGKTRMVVEIVGGGGNLFGSFKLFA